jgi:alpha-aminoadipic semialdehyde synthase
LLKQYNQGALEIFKELPHEFVPAKDLEKLVNDKSMKKKINIFKAVINICKDPNLKKLYATQLGVNDYIISKDGNRPLESPQDYLVHPEKYQSNFHQAVS